jgi:hypothetical protein
VGGEGPPFKGQPKHTKTHTLAHSFTHSLSHSHTHILTHILLTSELGYQAASFDRGRLKAALGRCGVPAVALGGITAGRVRECGEMGFGGVAVLGAVWQAEDPEAALLELLAECERAG